MELTVKTYSHFNVDFLDAVAQLEAYAAGINTNDKLIENYTQRLEAESWDAVSFYMNGSSVVGFSGILARPIFGNGARVLNRFYKDVSIRSDYRILPVTQLMIDQQVEAARELGYSFVFMSREKCFGANTFKRFIPHRTDWHIETARYRMWNTDEEGQYVAWTPIVPGGVLELTPA